MRLFPRAELVAVPVLCSLNILSSVVAELAHFALMDLTKVLGATGLGVEHLVEQAVLL
jgi:hypothetical protein